MNDSELGFTASVWTRDRDQRMASALEFGTVYMNRCDSLDPALPWTGMKNSGRGVPLSTLGFDALTRPSSFHHVGAEATRVRAHTILSGHRKPLRYSPLDVASSFLLRRDGTRPRAA